MKIFVDSSVLVVESRRSLERESKTKSCTSQQGWQEGETLRETCLADEEHPVEAQQVERGKANQRKNPEANTRPR